MSLKIGDVVVMNESRGGQVLKDDGSIHREFFQAGASYEIHSFTKAYSGKGNDKRLLDAVKFSDDQFFAVPITSVNKA